MDLRSALESEIKSIDAVRAALVAALKVTPRPKMARATLTARKPGQRHFTAAQRATQSRKMKAYWRKRRAAA